jgi:hypothetical protein
MCRRKKVRRNKNMPKFGKNAEFGARRKYHLYSIGFMTVLDLCLNLNVLRVCKYLKISN